MNLCTPSSTRSIEVQVKRESTFLAFLPLQMEVADNPGTSPLLLFLTHSLLQLARELRYEMELYSSCYIVSLVLCLSQVCCCVEGVPLYLYRARGGTESYIWREACTPLPLHVEEALPQQWEVGRCLEGSGRPLGVIGPWLPPLAIAFAWQALCWTWTSAPWCFAHFRLVWWASPLFFCANQRRKAPFGEIFHVFVFVAYKITFSKYMWN
jgi:hypothetical protein